MTKRYDIIWLDSVDSTNSEAKRRLSDIDNLSVMSALSQSEGRGQKGNKWSSLPGENLTFSIVLKFGQEVIEKSAAFQIPAKDQFVLTEITSLSVVEFLSRHGITAQIKWPNDIYVGKKKICGILIENSLRGEHLSSSTIGIGLNINQRNFNVNLPNPTSMSLETGNSEDIKACLEEFMNIFQQTLYSAASPNLALGCFASPNLRELYLSHLWRLNTPAQYLDHTVRPDQHPDHAVHPDQTVSPAPARKFTGIIRGLTPIGHLIIEDTTKGELKEFAFKEISYIL